MWIRQISKELSERHSTQKGNKASKEKKLTTSPGQNRSLHGKTTQDLREPVERTLQTEVGFNSALSWRERKKERKRTRIFKNEETK